MFGKINSDALVGVALLLIGGVGIWATFQISADVDGGSTARLFPFAGSIAITAFGLIELLQARPLLREPEPGSSKGLLQIAMMVALSVLYVWTLTRFGYLLSTSAAAVAIFLIFGIRNLIGLILRLRSCAHSSITLFSLSCWASFRPTGFGSIFSTGFRECR